MAPQWWWCLWDCSVGVYGTFHTFIPYESLAQENFVPATTHSLLVKMLSKSLLLKVVALLGAKYCLRNFLISISFPPWWQIKRWDLQKLKNNECEIQTRVECGENILIVCHEVVIMGMVCYLPGKKQLGCTFHQNSTRMSPEIITLCTLWIHPRDQKQHNWPWCHQKRQVSWTVARLMGGNVHWCATLNPITILVLLILLVLLASVDLPTIVFQQKHLTFSTCVLANVLWIPCGLSKYMSCKSPVEAASWSLVTRRALMGISFLGGFKPDQ